jgi:hypothetical protein
MGQTRGKRYVVRTEYAKNVVCETCRNERWVLMNSRGRIYQ